MAKIRKKRASKYDKIEVGTKFGDYTVIKQGTVRDKRGVAMLSCVCSCGRERLVLSSNLDNGNSKRCSKCRMSNSANLLNSEGSMNVKTAKGNHHTITNQWWSRIRQRSKAANLELDLDLDYLWSIYIAQDMKCNLTGLKIDFTLDVSDDLYPSPDRIDSSVGYVEGNIQLVRKSVNFMKGTLSQDEFIALCTLVHRNAP